MICFRLHLNYLQLLGIYSAMSLNNQYISNTHTLFHRRTHTLGGISLIGKHQIKQIHLNGYWGQIDSQWGDSGSMFLLASQTHYVVVCVCVCPGSVCLPSQLSVYSLHINSKMAVVVRSRGQTSSPRPGRVPPWTHPAREAPGVAPRRARETKTSACVSKHGPLSPPRGQELRII